VVKIVDVPGAVAVVTISIWLESILLPTLPVAFIAIHAAVIA
jgi:hypothetical protein